MLCFFNQNAPREISEFRATPAWVYLGLCWVYFGSMLGLCWVYVGSNLDLSWVYVGSIMGLCWVYFGPILNMFWVCFDGADADGDGENDDCDHGVTIKMAAHSSKN